MQNSIKLRTIFMGTSSFAAHILEDLIKNDYNIISVYTQGDKKVGRDQKIQKSAVKLIAEKENIKIFEPPKFNEEITEELKKQKPDLIIVASYGKILPKEVLEIPGFESINIHPSLLPKYRGPSPIQNSILDGIIKTGTTIMLMNEEIDTGDIISQKETTIKKNETYLELSQRMATLSSELLLETIPQWIERKITPKKQDEKKATYCQLIERADGKINWTDSANSIYNRFRAFQPWPGIFTYIEKNKYNLRLKLHKITAKKNIPDKKYHLGEIFQVKENIAIQTSDGIIILHEVQLEGKAKIEISDFVRGYPEFIGSILK